MLGLRVIRSAEAQRVHGRNRAGAHGEDVAQNAADAGRRTLIGLNVRRVVVALHLEDDDIAVIDIDDTGVSPGPCTTRGPLVGSVRSHFFEDL